MPVPLDRPRPRGLAPLAIAHRGGALLAAENTAAAFRAAQACGAEIVETDLRLSADGALVCLHDADLTRLAGDPRLVSETGLAALRTLLPEMMTLDEAIAASAPLGLLLDVKLADPAILPPMLTALAAAGATRRALLGLRDLGLIADASRLAPDIAILALLADPDSASEARAAGAGWSRLWQGDADPNRLAAIHAAGMQAVIMVGQPRSVAEPGYPPHPVGRVDAKGLARVLALRPDAVMLDDPRRLIAARSVTALSSA